MPIAREHGSEHSVSVKGVKYLYQLSEYHLFKKVYVQDDSKLLSGFPFIGHGNPDNNLKSFCVYYLIC
jgi:hypothetical protein